MKRVEMHTLFAFNPNEIIKSNISANKIKIKIFSANKIKVKIFN